METLKDTARVVDQTSSEGLEKAMELSENALQRAKETVIKDSAENTEASATVSTFPVVEGGLADKIQSEAAGAFEGLGDVTQPSNKQTNETVERFRLVASIEKLTPEFS